LIDQIRKEDVMLARGKWAAASIRSKTAHGDAETEEDGRFRLMWT